MGWLTHLHKTRTEPAQRIGTYFSLNPEFLKSLSLPFGLVLLHLENPDGQNFTEIIVASTRLRRHQLALLCKPSRSGPRHFPKLGEDIPCHVPQSLLFGGAETGEISIR